jgi:hypothetical protein
MYRQKLLIALVFILCTSSAFTQTPATSSSSSKCQFSEVLRQEGWTIPGVDSAKPKPRTSLARHAGMFVTMYEPLDAEVNLTIATCKSTQEGRLEIKDISVKIIRLWAFDAGSKPYAYRLEYADAASNDDKHSDPGSSSIIFFYDLDGSGLFTLFKYADSTKSSSLPSIIPDWAQNEMDQPTPH